MGTDSLIYGNAKIAREKDGIIAKQMWKMGLQYAKIAHGKFKIGATITWSRWKLVIALSVAKNQYPLYEVHWRQKHRADQY